MLRSDNNWIIIKFGGSSVASKSCWKTIAKTANDRISEGYRPLIVCSAISGVSSLLEELTNELPESSREKIIAKIEEKHINLCQSLELKEGRTVISDEWGKLLRLNKGVSLLSYCSPKTAAQIMSLGELMLTKIGSTWLNENNFETSWLDARNFLVQKNINGLRDSQHFLSTNILQSYDKDLEEKLSGQKGGIILTQGFIAKDSQNETIVLGRGGSDTSAALFAVMLAAKRVEIWTSVPGLFTTNPSIEPSARLLKHLDYEEAQELAASGAKVLHPRCLLPLQEAKIPVEIYWTEKPDCIGTKINSELSSKSSCLKAVIAKKGTYMISMDSFGMWQQSGFLANIFLCFKKHNLSIDLVATSQSNVSVTLDGLTNLLSNRDLEGLCTDLKKYCIPKILGPVSIISLVGKNIRSIIHELGPSFKAFEQKKIHLISQSTSDLNFTFAIDENDSDKIVKKLHEIFFSETEERDIFGESWSSLIQNENRSERLKKDEVWWRKDKNRLLNLASTAAPCYAYDEKTLSEKVGHLKGIKALSRINYAMKANSHPKILNLFYNLGLSFDCVSLAEINFLNEVIPNFSNERLVFTPNFASISEYVKAFEMSCLVTLDNIYPLEQHPNLFRGKEIFLRVDPGIGKGHHDHVKTAGLQSKFGISLLDIEKAIDLLEKVDAKVTGLHVHVGSGIKSAHTWADNAIFLADLAAQFKDVKTLNLGGGLGIKEKPGHQSLDISKVSQSLDKVKEAFPDFDFWLEPGRYLVAESGVLLTKVTQLKSKGIKNFVGVDTGMNSLMRPSLYGAYHEIVNLTSLEKEPILKADIVGPICETGDVFAYARNLPKTKENDILLVATAGAYGKVMASNYNKRSSAEEIYLI